MSIPDPVVLLDARARYVHPAFTCERASPKWLFGPDGQRHRVPENAMPWEYDPLTGQLLGLRVENGQTNIVPDCNISAWSTSSATVTSEDDGWYKVEAESTGQTSRTVQVALGAVTVGRYYTYSVDLRAGEIHYGVLSLSGGAFREGSATGARVAFDILDRQYAVNAPDELDFAFAEFKDIGNGAVRFSFCVRAIAAESPNCQVHLYHTLSQGSVISNLSAGDGIYIRAPQVSYSDGEFNTYPMSHVVTAGITAQTQPDHISAPILPILGRVPSRGTLLAEATPDINHDRAAVLSIYNGESDADERVVVEIRGNRWFGSARTQGNQIYTDTSVSAPRGQRGIIAASYDIGNEEIIVCANGAPAVSQSFTWVEGASFSNFWLGRFYSGGSGHANRLWNGWIRRALFYPDVYLTAAQLQSLTAIQE